MKTAAQLRFGDFWCECGKSEQSGVTFHDDYETADCKHAVPCSKHHYDCNNCGRVVQTG